MTWAYGCGECLYCRTLRREARRGRPLVISRSEYPRFTLGIRGELRAPIKPCWTSTTGFMRRRARWLARDLQELDDERRDAEQ